MLSRALTITDRLTHSDKGAMEAGATLRQAHRLEELGLKLGVRDISDTSAHKLAEGLKCCDCSDTHSWRSLRDKGEADPRGTR